MSERKKKVDRLTFIGTLAGGLAHEIKNPLSTISINLQLMHEDWQDAENPREKRTLKRISTLSKEIERLESIVNDFLTYARGFSLEKTAENINSVLVDLTTFLDPEAQRRSIEVRTYLDPNVPLVQVDTKYIRLALMNIIQNAFQAFEEDEVTRQVLVGTRGFKESVEITVTDTGSGIPAELRDRIFQVYFSTKRSGTGLGLATVKRIIEEHDGTISFRSEEGKGTSFTIHLPAVSGALPAVGGAGESGKKERE